MICGAGWLSLSMLFVLLVLLSPFVAIVVGGDGGSADVVDVGVGCR